MATAICVSILESTKPILIILMIESTKTILRVNTLPPYIIT